MIQLRLIARASAGPKDAGFQPEVHQAFSLRAIADLRARGRTGETTVQFPCVFQGREREGERTILQK